MVRYSNTLEHGPLPEAASSKEGRGRVHDAQGQDPLYRSRYHTKRKGVGVVFIPSLDIESERRFALSENQSIVSLGILQRTGKECK